MKTEKVATNFAKKILAKLPEGWKYDVWENLGWHVQWINGAVNLNYDECTKHFWCRIGSLSCPGTEHMDFWDIELDWSKHPIDAIKRACKQANEVIRKEWNPIIDSVNKVENQIKSMK